MMTLRYRRILVPHDFSEHSQAALTIADEIAAVASSTLHLLHVVAHSTVATAAPEGGSLVGVLAKSMQAAQERAQSELAAIARRSIGRVEVHVLHGAPAHEICELAAKLDVDLIVMGTHGRSGIARLLLGSTAETTLRHAPCPVLTVRPRAPAPHAARELHTSLVAASRRRAGQPVRVRLTSSLPRALYPRPAPARGPTMDPTHAPASRVPFRTILLAHDLSENSAAAFCLARDLAKLGDAKLHIVHVLELASDESAHAAARRALERLASRAELGAALHVVNGSPPHAICSLAGDLGADLIVMGTHGWSSYGRAVLGSVAVRTLLHAPAPVLTVRSRAERASG